MWQVGVDKNNKNKDDKGDNGRVNGRDSGNKGAIRWNKGANGCLGRGPV